MDAIDLAGTKDRLRGGSADRMPPEAPPAATGEDPEPHMASVYQPPSRRHGRPWIWSTGVGLLVVGAMLAGILYITLTEGLGQFWAAPVVELRLRDGSALLGEVKARGEQAIPGRGERAKRRLVRAGYREVRGVADFVWVNDADIASESRPADAFAIERVEYGHLFGYLHSVKGVPTLEQALEKGRVLRDRLKQVSRSMGTTADPTALARLERSRVDIEKEGRDIAISWRLADGTVVETPVIAVMHARRPNAMGFFAKIGSFVARVWEFFTTEPRESNSEGGIFPVIMGTLFLVVVMTLAAVPLGVVAAIYIHEYARDGVFLRAVRLAIANLAGVPSIVFGIFGLGFFVYTLGAAADSALFPGRGHPTFGTGGILWGALTLALLTVPVVIVAAGEGFASVPRAYRDGALALGATRWQTVWNVVLPQALPGILTGMILAVGRGAGEVAPLMVLGAAVKLAPQPLVDSAAPFLHLDRKFTHLGFHIYDVSMQSPNVEAAKPMTYASTLALMGLILALNLVAILVRARLRKRFAGAAL